MIRKSGWEVRDVSLQHCTKDGYPNVHNLIIPTSGEQLDLKLDIELLNTQTILQIRRTTAKEIINLP